MYRARGFTLLEILVALAIMGIVLVFAANAVKRVFQQSRVRDAAVLLATDLQNIRSNAWRTNTTTQLDLISATSYSFTISGKTITRNLPVGISIDGGGNTQVRYSAPNAENTRSNPVVFTVSGASGTQPIRVKVIGVTGKVVVQ
ncbi:prepilin-type N-terminal cleavage/methylation domain-containing protein [Allomeiothermus silvanus]|uniref:prepilin-type N-terminal cleavage/methylation domain-containing protein n=1 Tax=Allomeiothermus silvanus TaxID=52022 RepID=UPI0023F04DDC|nr:prepilin-type N-terminal cleavage/methylation domain-containing protein [Allomeiothermus silvanus]